jgi:hypothetical protein
MDYMAARQQTRNTEQLAHLARGVAAHDYLPGDTQMAKRLGQPKAYVCRATPWAATTTS